LTNQEISNLYELGFSVDLSQASVSRIRNGDHRRGSSTTGGVVKKKNRSLATAVRKHIKIEFYLVLGSFFLEPWLVPCAWNLVP